MTKASKFLKRLDQVLSKSCNEFHERDIDAPQVMHEVFDDLRKLLAKASSADWKEIYIERDKADIKTHVLNQAMELSTHHGQPTPTSSTFANQDGDGDGDGDGNGD
jgi:hypothetical protein